MTSKVGTMSRSAGSCLVLAVAGAVCLGLIGRVLFGFNAFVVLSASMRPHYPPGSVVVTRLVPSSSVSVGAIIVYTPPNQAAPLAHRVVALAGDPRSPLVTTRGDANAQPDPWRARLSAAKTPVVVAGVPGAGWVLRLMHVDRRESAAVLVGLLGLAVTVSYARRIYSAPCSGCSKCPRGRRSRSLADVSA